MDIYPMARQMLVLLALTAGLWLLHIYGPVLPTAAIAAAWLLLCVVLARALFLRARLRRRAWLGLYFHPRGSLFTLLRGGLLMALVQILLAAGLALLTITAVLRSTDPLIWTLLLAMALLLPPLQSLTQRQLQGQASSLYLQALAWQITSTLLGLLLVIALTWHAFLQMYPDFAAVTLEQAVWHMVGQQQARSPQLLTLLQVAAAGDGLRLWLAQQLLPTPGPSLWQSLGWLLVLAQEALFVWSYLLLCRGLTGSFEPLRDERASE
ncbi:MAG: hypothetical protein Q8L60_08980 [Gammaproteobacteria bacterium]|nr:hypothetical protein [Gammaproteobacteria bacterium]MDP2140614.1 hypothetical protein [Gammaproteobacteria bacterium]MDP2347386.1 hypothetical protein [Gammaproteobacteria bacterium]